MHPNVGGGCPQGGGGLAFVEVDLFHGGRGGHFIYRGICRFKGRAGVCMHVCVCGKKANWWEIKCEDRVGERLGGQVSAAGGEDWKVGGRGRSRTRMGLTKEGAAAVRS